ncbi:hypothetical protein [Streptomyces griseosporeus]|uniref:hypothetical protein n=1 Tax=Streptomyces griseosporeus TaxID=1910 RepID=UPI00167CC570|nr:hypothetical protein [Streptomyces griseosporeus]GHF36643.1 hypothetical protein GCM10018783_01200 [Streptomyces griseosporeus]
MNLDGLPADITLSAGRSVRGLVHTTGGGPSSGRAGSGSGSGIVLIPTTIRGFITPPRKATPHLTARDGSRIRPRRP